MAHKTPEWFKFSEEATPDTLRRINKSVSGIQMSVQVRTAPLLAYWFLLDTMSLANQANRQGMHANALILTRQCVEAIGVIELGICGHTGAEGELARWQSDQLTAGKLRGWLERNMWPHYGNGLWAEPWANFMGEFARALQPYAHYSHLLAQWQLRSDSIRRGGPGEFYGLMQVTPRAYDTQKATRITLFHALISFILARIWIAANPSDRKFAAKICRLGSALGGSRYLDGHQTDWGHQFWAMLWDLDSGETVLE